MLDNYIKNMRWFKHLIESGDDPDIGTIMAKLGFKGYYLFFRTIEIMSREFSVQNPGKNTFNFNWFLQRFTRTVRKKDLISFLNLCQELKDSEGRSRISYKIIGDKIELNCPKLKDLADKYTEEMMRSERVEWEVKGQSVGSKRAVKGKLLDIPSTSTSSSIYYSTINDIRNITDTPFDDYDLKLLEVLYKLGYKLKRGKEKEMSDWLDDLNKEFDDVNIQQELKKFYDWWSDSRRKIKNYKNSLRNWLINARRFAKK